MKRWVSLCLTFFLLLSVTACQKDTPLPEEEPLPVTGDMEIAVLSVGKADAVVITTATKTAVIDAGEIDDGGKVLNYLAEKGRQTIDYLVITHYDRDHVGGADRLLNFIQVKQVIRPDYDGVREEYTTFRETLSALDIPDNALKSGSPDLTLPLDDVQLTVNSPKSTTYVNDKGEQQDNNFSLVVRARHGKNAFLFAGDCEDARLAELLTEESTVWQSAFLKLPYHGNFTELTTAFLQRVAPTFAVACDSDKNPMAEETQAALSSLGCATYATRNGTVLCHSDGQSLEVSQPKDN